MPGWERGCRELNSLQRNCFGIKRRGTPVVTSQIIVSLEAGSGVDCNYSEVEDDCNWVITLCCSDVFKTDR